MVKNKKTKTIQLKPSDGKINLLIILVLIVGFIASMGVFFLLSENNECYVPEKMSLNEQDFNRMVTISSTVEYNGGFCERLGLESNILVRDLNGTPYGVPICVAGEE